MILLPLSKTFLILGIILGFFGVAFGAFGAHALKQKISADYLAIFEVGVRYQMYHALLLMVIAFIYAYFPVGYVQAAGWLTFLGTLIFSGSLYILTLTGVSMWGAVTPIGGLMLLGGWLMLLFGILRS
jgi:uncharacterized membrane protein YgdD (TMEM256/DUF423 family)